LWLGQPIAQWLFARAEIGAGGPDGAAETDEPLPEILRFLTSAEAQQRWRSAHRTCWLAIFLMINAVTPFITPDTPWLANHRLSSRSRRASRADWCHTRLARPNSRNLELRDIAEKRDQLRLTVHACLGED